MHTESDVKRESEGTGLALWMGLAAGAALGIGIALSRRRRSRWQTARVIGRRVVDKSADSTRNIVDRVRVISEEARKALDEAAPLWKHGRKLFGA